MSNAISLSDKGESVRVLQDDVPDQLTDVEIDDVAGGSMLEELLQMALGALLGKAAEKDFKGQIR